MKTTEQQRRDAAGFYYKPSGITGVVEDWIRSERLDEPDDVDPDVRELAEMLAKRDASKPAVPTTVHAELLQEADLFARGIDGHARSGALVRALAKALRAEITARDTDRQCRLANEAELLHADGMLGEAGERLAHCENVLREAANCIAPPDLFGERGLEEDDAEYHIEAQRSVDAYFEKYPDAKGDKP